MLSFSRRNGESVAHIRSPSPPQPIASARGELDVRADERRRIARELHDSTSQTLVVLQLQLGRLRRMNRPGAEPIIENCEEAIDSIREQLRALDVE
jgi:signal transduction histidine kinase